MKEIDKNQNQTKTKKTQIEELSQNVEKNTKEISFLVQQQTSFSGPLPPPQILEEYRRIYKDAPKIIFSVFEKEQKERINTIRIGQYSALLIGLCGLISTTILGLYGNPWVAGGIGFLSLGSLVGAFLYNKK